MFVKYYIELLVIEEGYYVVGVNFFLSCIVIILMCCWKCKLIGVLFFIGFDGSKVWIEKICFVFGIEF